MARRSLFKRRASVRPQLGICHIFIIVIEAGVAERQFKSKYLDNNQGFASLPSRIKQTKDPPNRVRATRNLSPVESFNVDAF
jgi:hypothetical protein